MRVAVVGAGFSGLVSSIYLSRVANVTLFEEHGEVGVPEHCTGVVSGAVWEALSSFVSSEVNEGALEEFFLGLPEGVGVTLKGPKGFAAKLDRRRLEEELLETALAEGVKFVKKLVIRVTPKGYVDNEKYDRAVIAEGWRAELSERLGVAAKPRRVYGLNLEVVGRAAYPGRAEVWFDKSLAPGFFSWVVMLDGKAVVGTAATKGYDVRALARKALEVAERRGLVEGEVKKEYGGVIQTGPPSLTPCASKVCATGDAAGLNKPVTGGGLYPSLYVASRYPSNVDNLVKAYRVIVPRLLAETPVARALHGAPQRAYVKLFTALDGEVLRVTEYDNHLKTLAELVQSKKAFKLLKALLKAFYPL
ncbi:dehydrogenase (flavoprotein)-like protein [Ignicoccus hospitalis]|uniref:Dehydrogenase (Flavoprotein)-like protein n=1 Tax=Ignicoccus hospitalis (strain KIN4/I / DSM 18386 / JCM 14125) TaxID=453591 RepID=A8AA13_IGNH4|nr:dehydrogenase (flavoprotein)-like protein [Ignicoccus hospitalis]ABU81765.1 Dehydrogenase (flavoprotein)-like protein [Ignicoccus hospitalis KIN4/I]HIH90033.1 hypothetical protein [Desulfurococcaceae archaeon]